MADTIKLRRILNQACFDGTNCYEIDCWNKAACVPGSFGKILWWVDSFKIPCFVSSHNEIHSPIHQQDPMK